MQFSVLNIYLFIHNDHPAPQATRCRADCSFGRKHVRVHGIPRVYFSNPPAEAAPAAAQRSQTLVQNFLRMCVPICPILYSVSSIYSRGVYTCMCMCV